MIKLKITLITLLPLIFLIIGAVSVESELLEKVIDHENETMVCEQIMYNLAGTFILLSDCASGGPGSSECSNSGSWGSCSVTCNSGYYSCCGTTCGCVSTEPEESG